MKDEKDIVGFWNWGDNVKGLKNVSRISLDMLYLAKWSSEPLGLLFN